MRIIGGALGGRKIRAPHGQATRPTSDRVREAIFNILGPPPEGARVLDLFAGAGGLGMEALSRGAASATFVDDAVAAARCVGDNLLALGLQDRGQVLRLDARRALARLVAAGARFAWVFLDPPYAGDEAERALAELGGPMLDLLAEEAVVVVEHDRRRSLAAEHGALARRDERRYGDTLVSFYGRHHVP